MRTVKWMCGVKLTTKQAVGGRRPQYAPTLSSYEGAEAHRTAEPTVLQSADRNVAGSHGQYVPTLTAV